jgi:hypothetical protein
MDRVRVSTRQCCVGSILGETLGYLWTEACNSSSGPHLSRRKCCLCCEHQCHNVDSWTGRSRVWRWWSRGSGTRLRQRSVSYSVRAPTLALSSCILIDLLCNCECSFSLLTTNSDRSFYLGMVGAVWAVASALGPVLGGVFAEQLNWRWCFFINRMFHRLPVLLMSSG